MKTVRISLNSIDKVKSFVNDLAKFDVDFDLVSGRYAVSYTHLRAHETGPSWASSAWIFPSPST